MSSSATRAAAAAAASASSGQASRPRAAPTTLKEFFPVYESDREQQSKKLDSLLELFAEFKRDHDELRRENAALKEQTTELKQAVTAARKENDALKSRQGFLESQLLDLADQQARANNAILRGVATNADAASLKQQVTDQLVEAGAVDLRANDIESTIRLAPTIVKVVFRNKATRDRVFYKRHAMRTNADPSKRLTVSEDLTKAQQTHVKKMQPVFQKLRREAAAEGRWGPFFRNGLLHYHPEAAPPGQKPQAALHQANWDQNEVQQAVMDNDALAAQAAAGQGPPAASAPGQA